MPKLKNNGVVMFLAGLACAAMLAGVLVLAPKSHAENDSCIASGLAYQGFGTRFVYPGSSVVLGYDVSCLMTECLKIKGLTIAGVDHYNGTITVHYIR